MKSLQFVFILLFCSCTTNTDNTETKIVKLFPSGKKSMVLTYKNGKLDGAGTIYYESGKIRALNHYVFGLLQGKQQDYYPNGYIKSELTYKENEINGPYSLYYNNGKIQTQGYMLNGHDTGTKRTYLPTGRLKTIETIVNDRPNGIFIYYHSNGKIKAVGVQHDNKFDGIVTYYDSVSTDSTRLLFANGKFIKKL